MQNLTGQNVGRYHIIEQLGEGGMATVYKAFDTNLECEVAVKTIRVDELPPASVERTLKRFKREAKETAQLLHTNIVRVMDFGEYDGIPYLVMPFVPGGTLKQKLNSQNPMPYQEAARLLAPIARALDFAHKRGVAHRDVKPANILITDDGQPMLTDFGVAKILENDRRTTELTGAGIAIGTPEYMAPEQWMGRELDGRADIYSLGVVFYEMITGHTPFSADTVPAVMVMALRDPLPRPRDFVKGLPDFTEQVLYKALAREPENRYQEMGQFANDLEQLAQNERGKPEKLKPVRNNQQYEKSTFIGIGVLVIFSMLGIYFLGKLNTKNISPETQIAITSDSKEVTNLNQSNSTQTSSTQIQILTQTTTSDEKGNDPIPGDFHWEFEKDGFKQGWGEIAFHDVSGIEVKDGLLFFHSTGVDPYIFGPMLQSIDSSKFTKINLRMKIAKVSSETTGQIYFITDQDQNWDENKKIEYRIKESGNFEEYSIDISKNANWKEIIKGLRIDPTEGSESDIWIDYIRLSNTFEKSDGAASIISKDLFSNMISNTQVLFDDEFDRLSMRWENWGGAEEKEIKNGELIFHGDSETIPSIHRHPPLIKNEGIFTNFKVSKNSEMQLKLTGGQYPSSTWRDFGIEIRPENGLKMIRSIGSNYYGGQSLEGNIRFGPDKWFTVFLFITDTDQLYVRVWETDAPDFFSEYVFKLDEDWANLDWGIQILSTNGIVEIDKYKEILLNKY